MDRHDGFPVLLVDDEPLIRDSIGFVLATHGFRVRTAASVADAVRLLDPRSMLIVTDWEMTGASGLDFCRLLRRTRDRDFVIVFTARDAAVARQVALAAGADLFVSKNTAVNELLDALNAGRHALSRRVSER